MVLTYGFDVIELIKFILTDTFSSEVINYYRNGCITGNFTVANPDSDHFDKIN